MKRKFVLSRVAGAGALAILASALCQGQPRLSLEEAVRQALASRASLRAEAERISVAEGLRKQAGTIPNPEFQFQNENLRPGQTYGRDVDTLAMINQPLDILGKRRERIAVADRSVQRSRADYDSARWEIARQVRIAYWAARGAQEVRDVLKSTVENFQKIVDYHANQLSVGAIAEQDLLRVRLERERLSISADLAVIDVDRSRMDLLKEMGRTDFADILLTEPLGLDASIQPVGAEQVVSQRAEVKAARAAVEEAQANVKLQDVAARPDLNLTYGYKRTELPDTAAGVNTAIFSLRVTLPVTDKNQGNRAAALAEVRRRQELLHAIENQVRMEYSSAAHEYELRRAEVINALQPLREHAATLSQIAAAAYAEGGVDLLRFLDAERSRLDAELAWARGMSEYGQSIAKLLAAEGVEQ
ncbi:MAG TPA: TolC family protein [Bryobacteraceae bacterium]